MTSWFMSWCGAGPGTWSRVRVTGSIAHRPRRTGGAVRHDIRAGRAAQQRKAGGNRECWVRIGTMGRSVRHGDDLFGRNATTARAGQGRRPVGEPVHDAVSDCADIRFAVIARSRSDAASPGGPGLITVDVGFVQPLGAIGPALVGRVGNVASVDRAPPGRHSRRRRRHRPARPTSTRCAPRQAISAYGAWVDLSTLALIER